MKVSKEKKGPSFLSKAYLLLYNGGQVAGWGYLLYQLAQYRFGADKGLWDAVKLPLYLFQNAAVLEIVHAATGLVPSNVMFTLMQVFSRVFVVCGVLAVTEAAPAGLGLPICIAAWSITEIVRYSYYTLNLLGGVPKFLIYLRYTLFIALYPIGITGELLSMYHAQQEVASTKMWSYSMPNKYNFAFDYRYFLIIYMLLYIPNFPILYGHMFAQRKKVLGGGGDVSKGKKVK